MSAVRNFPKQLLAWVLAATLAVFSISFTTPQSALADTSLADAEASAAASQNALEAARAKLAQISSEYDALSSEIDELQLEIDELASSVLEAQKAMLEGRSSLSNTAVYEYRSSSLSTLIDSILGSSSLSELDRNMTYMSQIMDHHAKEIESQKELKDQFATASDKLTTQKDEQDAKLEELNQKREEATKVVEEAAATVAEDSQELAELRQQAQSFIWKSAPVEEPAPEQNDEADTTDRNDVVSDATPVIPDPKPQAPSNEGGWLRGIASAYGGSSDPYTPNPGKTATGAICDDNSMGVALPMSMPNYWTYYGRTVEIQYNGMTVYATVNDCGGMGGGSRVLDLQPGVFKAFGYGDCYSWGLRTVSYRFI